MKDKPLVSVILPVYNGEEFIGQALESALCQTYRAIEVIVIDDGSTDGTPVILKSYVEKDTRVRVIRQANAGVARARNRAISIARGDFIAPLDADDLWEPEKIERQLHRMLRADEETGLVYASWVWIDRIGIVLDRSPRWAIEGDAFDLLVQTNFIGNASVPLIRRSCLELAGGYNEELAALGAGGCEDWELALRIAERFRVAVVPEVLVGYRRRPGSMSTEHQTMARSHQVVMRAMQEIRPGLKSEIVRRSAHQFALYLAGLSFWAGDFPHALRWSFRAGLLLPLLASPYVAEMLLRRLLPDPASDQIMLPGFSLDPARIPEPLVPYDRIYKHRRARSQPGTYLEWLKWKAKSIARE